VYFKIFCDIIHEIQTLSHNVGLGTAFISLDISWGYKVNNI